MYHLHKKGRKKHYRKISVARTINQLNVFQAVLSNSFATLKNEAYHVFSSCSRAFLI